MKILIVDDDPLMRWVLRTALADHEIYEAEDGQSGWDMWQREHPSLVITDWIMPGLGGLELTRKIRGAGFPRYPYIIMLTIKGQTGQLVSAFEAGVDDFLRKPVNKTELKARINAVVRIISSQMELAQAAQQLETMAMNDMLTGLMNRRAIYMLSEAQLIQSQRQKTSISVAMIDIDHFKSINDCHGHLIGDKALKFVADIFESSKRPYDLIGRWAGDEFLLILSGVALTDAKAVVERIREHVFQTRLTLDNGTTLPITISAGVTSISGLAEIPRLEDLIKQADNALYEAKRNGRNRVEVFTHFTPLSPSVGNLPFVTN